MVKVTGFIQLMRPINCTMMSLAVLVGGVLASANLSNFPWLSIVFGALTGFTLTAASMAVNDYYDRKIDAINEPARPIPSGTVTPKPALVFTGVLTLIGLAFAYLTSILCLLAAVIAWIMMITYTTIGKRSGLPGNFLVSVCVATPFVYGSLASTNGVQLNVLLFASMAFLSNTGREVTKGVVDVQGDRANNIKTVAERFGEKKAAAVSVFFYVSAVCLSPIPIILNLASFWYVPIVSITDIGLIVCSALLIRKPDRENARKVKKLILFLFIIGLVAFIFGKFG